MSHHRLNAYRIMWLFVMFDLPTVTVRDKKEYTRFKKDLERDGFTMYQYSVYIRYCGSLESAQVHVKRLKSFRPHRGFVSVLMVTDKQYGNIINIWGETPQNNSRIPIQLEIF